MVTGVCCYCGAFDGTAHREEDHPGTPRVPPPCRCGRPADHDGPHVCGSWIDPRHYGYDGIPKWRCALDAGHAGTHDPSDEVMAAADREDERKRKLAWFQMCWPRYRDARMDNLDQPAKIIGPVQEWIEADGGNLFLRGPVGTGKTWLAIAALREMFIVHQYRVILVSGAGLLARLKPEAAGGDATPATFIKPDYLLLDDISPEKPSEWALEQFYAVIDGRSRQCKPIVVTSNLSSVELEMVYGARIADRLKEDAVIVNVGGKSRRKPVGLRAVPDQSDDRSVNE